MKIWYYVSFKYSEKVYCTNLCYADSKEQVEEYYQSKYEWVSVKPAADWEVDTYKRRGMPVKNL